jgi:chemotaxis protein CheX
LDIADIAAGVLPVAAEIRAQLLEPFIAATTAALCEMAGIDVVAQAAGRRPHPALLDINALVELESALGGPLILSFPKQTAAAIAGRVLAGAGAALDESLLHDCVGEIGNVVAGQAKALLAGTAYRLAFALPQVLVGPGELPVKEGFDCLVVALSSAQGPFALQLCLGPRATELFG